MSVKKKGRSHIAYYLAMAVLSAVFFWSGGILLTRYAAEQGYEKDLNRMAAMFPGTGTPAKDQSAAAGGAGQKPHGGEGAGGLAEGRGISPKQWKLWWEQEAESRFQTYGTLKGQNPDMVGWVRIEGTMIDYPVMQTPDEPDYYQYRDFEKKKSNYGIPYMAEFCRYDEPGTNLLVYGHHMKNGAMFAALDGYTEASYYREHPYIQFDTADRAGSYEIAAVVRIDASDEHMPWRDLLFPAGQAVWEWAWETFEQQSLYQTGVNLEYGDRLLALVTCEYTLEDGRLMVVSKEIR